MISNGTSSIKAIELQVFIEVNIQLKEGEKGEMLAVKITNNKSAKINLWIMEIEGNGINIILKL